MLGRSIASKPRFIRAILNTKRAMSVLYTVQDTARVVTLNRVQKLNALNYEMCKSMFDTLEEYSKSDAAQLIVLKSANQPRSLCAGGDVASVAALNLNGETDKAIDVFQSEYSLNYQFATYDKPIVVFMDGITMGGGVGLSIHTPFRVATENTKWAMPEMDIGFFPDVGTSFALPRILTVANKESQLALYLCLTGDLISGADCYYLGLASHYVPHDNLDDLQKRLGELIKGKYKNKDFYSIVSSAIEEFSTPLPKTFKPFLTVDKLDVIDKCFKLSDATTSKSIISTLQDYSGTEEANQFRTAILDKLLVKSPTSMELAIKLIRTNGTDDIQSALSRDLITAANMCIEESSNPASQVEFSRSTKHKLLDKIKTPYPWTTKIDSVSTDFVNSLLTPRPSIPVSLWKNRANCTWREYPYHWKYQLPSENVIEQYITNKKNTYGVDNLPKEEVVDYFSKVNKITKDKLGIKQYISFIVDRLYNNSRS
ncbi:hypothetical protein TBLA_0E02580 [Henningerozyma blattae CBS 6284]|uniref:3-hydroxyisobutyryl-CoA hydrolase n=1 Tax=Henningerozyma blattae (strain ATCC 34711 / CBS 6284 / DSM 70876 / NBRC 10599 / NRRL Y-10934 / UCD 77-7) TaxID=1071380 RepID=I2H4L2_HENB6|nr:hypothetical protein TBLA_0E02580 [Tetrapisispora blattae CBS 6284]CCH61314.1 hypothetical protein TBLA_0E02580 [Tetrapisispora blattae CBS 6284]